MFVVASFICFYTFVLTWGGGAGAGTVSFFLPEKTRDVGLLQCCVLLQSSPWLEGRDRGGRGHGSARRVFFRDCVGGAGRLAQLLGSAN